MSARRLDAAALRDWAHGAVEDLIAHSDEINGLNVFPVADADTGTNMLFTMRSAWVQADACTGGVAAVASALATGALHGARGNSGVILSQILRGLADATAAADRAADLAEVDTALFAAALRRGVDLVVASLGETVAGTIVSVLAVAAEAAESATAAGDPLAAAIAAVTDAAAAALDATTGQLDVLTAAGVVDAGGRGLLVLLDALARTVTGDAPRRDRYVPASDAPHPSAPSAVPPQFEVMYLLSDCAPDGVEVLRGRLEDLGDSVAIAASGASGGTGYSVHVHADDAGAAVEAGLSVGTPHRIQITALSAAAPARPAGGWHRGRAVLAVVDGPGAADLFAGEGAHVLRRPDDGQPVSAKHLLRALVDTGAARTMVLPNGYVAAEELVAGCAAATGLGVDVVPVPAASMVQGLAALAVHDPARHAVDDGYTMARAAASARHGAVRVATEEALTWAGTCSPGDGLGISGDEVLIVGPDLTTAAAGLIDLLLLSGGELVTVLTGAEADDAVGEALRAHVHARHPGTELVTYRTGHRGDALLIGVE